MKTILRQRIMRTVLFGFAIGAIGSLAAPAPEASATGCEYTCCGTCCHCISQHGSGCDCTGGDCGTDYLGYIECDGRGWVCLDEGGCYCLC